MLDKLIDKYPMYDPYAPDEIQAAWFAGFARLLDLVEPRLVAEMPPSAPLPVPTPRPSANGHEPTLPPRPIDRVDAAQALQFARSHKSNQQAADAWGITSDKAGYHMRKARRALAEEERAAAKARFPGANTAATTTTATDAS